MPWWKSDNAKVIVSACFVVVVVAGITFLSWDWLVRKANGQCGTAFGLVFTVLGSGVGGIALVLTILIYRWTGHEDAARHRELKADNDGLRAEVTGLRADNARLREDVDKQTTQGAELLDAVRTLGVTIRDLIQERGPSSALSKADLSKLSDDELAELQKSLHPNEVVVRIERSGSGRGNHPWQAVTSEGRLLHVYTGGRYGRVYVSEPS